MTRRYGDGPHGRFGPHTATVAAALVLVATLVLAGCLGGPPEDERAENQRGFVIEGPHAVDVVNGATWNATVVLYVQNVTGREHARGPAHLTRRISVAGGERERIEAVARDGERHLVYVGLHRNGSVIERRIAEWHLTAGTGSLTVGVAPSGELEVVPAKA